MRLFFLLALVVAVCLSEKKPKSLKALKNGSRRNESFVGNATVPKKKKKRKVEAAPSTTTMALRKKRKVEAVSETVEQMLRRQWQVLREYILKEQETIDKKKEQRGGEPAALAPQQKQQPEDPVRIYARACERFGSKPNGAVLASARYASKVVRPSRLDGDGDLLALVEALAHPAFRVAALDLGDADGTLLTKTATSFALSQAINEGGLEFLALAPGTPLDGSHAVERLLLASKKLKVLKVADCFLGDAGCDSLTRLLPRVSGTLERLDVSRNLIGPRAASRLRDAAQKHKISLKLRGNCRWLERSCGLIQLTAATVTPLAGAFLVYETSKRDIDVGALTACILYSLTTTAFFFFTGLPHLREARMVVPPSSKGGEPLLFEQRTDLSLDYLARFATCLAVAGAHAPFIAFLDLGLPRNFGVFLWTASLAFGVANVLQKRRDFASPPTLRAPSLSADKIPLVVLTGFLAFLRFPQLRAALSPSAFRCLLASLILAVVSTALDLTPLCKPIAYLMHLFAAALHYICILTALVYHFTPVLSPPKGKPSPNHHHNGPVL